MLAVPSAGCSRAASDARCPCFPGWEARGSRRPHPKDAAAAPPRGPRPARRSPPWVLSRIAAVVRVGEPLVVPQSTGPREFGRAAGCRPPCSGRPRGSARQVRRPPAHRPRGGAHHAGRNRGSAAPRPGGLDRLPGGWSSGGSGSSACAPGAPWARGARGARGLPPGSGPGVSRGTRAWGSGMPIPRETGWRAPWADLPAGEGHDLRNRTFSVIPSWVHPVYNLVGCPRGTSGARASGEYERIRPAWHARARTLPDVRGST